MTLTQKIVAERRRQIKQEGFTPEHDDEHIDGSLVQAASAYVMLAMGNVELASTMWPSSWDRSWFKIDTTPERCIVKAGALQIAELERLSRRIAKKEAEKNATVSDSDSK